MQFKFASLQPFSVKHIAVADKITPPNSSISGEHFIYSYFSYGVINSFTTPSTSLR